MRQLRGSNVTPVLSPFPAPPLSGGFLPPASAPDYSRVLPRTLEWRERMKGSGMRPFQLNSEMRTMRGVFYPTGWLVLLLPGEQHAREAARKLAAAGIAEDRMMLMTPADFQREIAGSQGDEGILPSAGTEGDTVRKMAELVGHGHHGLFIHAPDQADSERVMQALRGVPVSFGQKYRTLIIEDVVE